MEERNETVNWANSLSRQCSSVLFFSPYSPYSRGFLVCPIVPSLAHTLAPRRWGRFISYLLNFIKHPGRQHGRIFHFLVSKGIAQKGRVSWKMENARRWLRRAALSSGSPFFLRLSRRSSIHLPRYTYWSLFFLRRPFSERELGVTNQPTCFTFKSFCRAAISNRVHRMACVRVYSLRLAARDVQLSTGDAGQCFFRTEISRAGPSEVVPGWRQHRDSEVWRRDTGFI